MVTRLVLIIVFVIQYNFPQSTRIIGTWQINDSLVASGMADTYRFYDDGMFNFDFSAFNYNARFINISGKYTVTNDKITFCIDKIVESRGGEISFGDHSSDYNNWAIVNDKYISSKMKKIKSFTVKYNLSQNKNVLNIDGLLFYLVSKNPNEFRDSFRFPKE